MPWIDRSNCKKCYTCLAACPIDNAIEKSGDGPIINQSVCTKCGICMDACPENTIRPNSENPSLRGEMPFGKSRGIGQDLRHGDGAGQRPKDGRGRGTGKGQVSGRCDGFGRGGGFGGRG